MKLPKDAIITEPIFNEVEEEKVGNIFLATGVKKDVYHKVIYTGENVKHLQDKIIRPKESMGEKLDIDFKTYVYFTSGEHSYFYIDDKG